MLPSFNIEKLTSLLKNFYTLTQIRITVFDATFTELTAYPTDIPPICKLIRTDPNALEKCRQCDKKACQIAAQKQSTYTYRCHAGLTESIMPLSLGNKVIGYLFFGHALTYPSVEEAQKAFHTACINYRIDHEQLLSLCEKHPLISHEYVESAAQIVHAVASYVCLERMVILKQPELFEQIDTYLLEHYTESINVNTICERFQIGKTRLYAITREHYGCGLAEQIRLLRIKKAIHLLTEHPELSLAEVAIQCGFYDYNYFITAFKRVTGLPPMQYAKSKR